MMDADRKSFGFSSSKELKSNPRTQLETVVDLDSVGPDNYDGNWKWKKLTQIRSSQRENIHN